MKTDYKVTVMEVETKTEDNSKAYEAIVKTKDLCKINLSRIFCIVLFLMVVGFIWFIFFLFYNFIGTKNLFNNTTVEIVVVICLSFIIIISILSILILLIHILKIKNNILKMNGLSENFNNGLSKLQKSGDFYSDSSFKEIFKVYANTLAEL